MLALTLKTKVRLSLQNIAGVNIVAVAITTVTSFKQYKLYRMCPNSVILTRSQGAWLRLLVLALNSSKHQLMLPAQKKESS